MRLTGNEVLTIPDYRNPGQRRRLRDMCADEVLACANEAAMDRHHALADALYAWQWRLRCSGMTPRQRPPDAA